MQQIGIESDQIKSGFCLQNTLKFKERLGVGAFGEVWLVVSQTNGEDLACKVEKKKSPCKSRLLEREIQFLLELYTIQGLPRVKIYGQDANHHYMACTLLGKNLEEVRKAQPQIPQIYVLQVAVKILQILQQVHNRGLLHRDIKPENMMTAKGTTTEVYLIDFGLAKRFMVDQKHIPFSRTRGLVGTARYASFRALKGYEQSRRDDLESLFYSMVYLLQGPLPWSHVVAPNKSEKYRLIQQQKEHLEPERVWPQLPNSLLEYFYQVRQLEFEEEPNYKLLISILNHEIHSLKQIDTCMTESLVLGEHTPIRKFDTLTPQFQSMQLLREQQFKTEKTLRVSINANDRMVTSQGLSKSNNLNSSSYNSWGFEEFDEQVPNSIQKVFLTEAIKHPHSQLPDIQST